ncbi:Tetraspanin-4 [Dissostichus eleginoides]|nr:Tetraspanin-4 [Dissostichus eleginoides]
MQQPIFKIDMLFAKMKVMLFVGCLKVNKEFGVDCGAVKSKIDHYAQRDLKKGLQLFGTEGNVGLTNAWMIVQTDFRCCGVTNHTDWFEVYNASRVPDSCCLEYSDNCGLDNPGTWWTAPCYERVKDWLNENLVALWIFALCTALTQILGLVFSMTMFCQAVKVETFYA